MIGSGPRPGQSVEEHADELRANGEIGDEDVDAIKKFAAFLRDAGRAPELDAELEPVGEIEPLSMEVIERHQDILGISDERLAEIKAERAVDDA